MPFKIGPLTAVPAADSRSPPQPVTPPPQEDRNDATNNGGSRPPPLSSIQPNHREETNTAPPPPSIAHSGSPVNPHIRGLLAQFAAASKRYLQGADRGPSADDLLLLSPKQHDLIITKVNDTISTNKRMAPKDDVELKFNALIEFNEFYRHVHDQSADRASPRHLFLHACKTLKIAAEYMILSHLWQIDPEINLSGYDLGNLRLQALAASIQAGLSPIIKSFNLKSNRLLDAGVDAFFSALAEGKCLIEDIDLSHNSLQFIAVPHFLEVLNLGFLLKLNLANNSLGSRKGVQCLCEALQADECQTLTWLDLSRNEIENSGALHLARVLKSGRNILSLGLAWNTIGVTGATELLSGECSLKTLDLAHNSIGTVNKDSFVILARTLAGNMILRHLDLSSNHLSAPLCEVLATALVENTALIGLHVEGNAAELDQQGSIVVRNSVNPGIAASTHDDILYFPEIYKNADCWLCGRWVEVKFQWQPHDRIPKEQAFSGEVSLHLSTDKPPYKPIPMRAVGEGRFELWQMVQPGRLEYYFTIRRENGVEHQPVESASCGLNGTSAQSLIRVLSNYKGINTPKWQSVSTRIFGRELMSTFHPIISSNSDNHSSSAISKSLLFTDPISLDSKPNLDTFVSNVTPRLGWMRKKIKAEPPKVQWSLSQSIFASRRPEIDARAFYDEVPASASFSTVSLAKKKKSVAARAFEADIKRTYLVETINRYAVDEMDSAQALELLEKNFLGILAVFKYYCTKNEDPFSLSRACFMILMNDMKLESYRSSSDVIYYSATSDRKISDQTTDNKRYQHLVLHQNKHAMANNAHKQGARKTPPFSVVLDKFLQGLLQMGAIEADSFRLNWLYNQSIDDLFRKYEVPLRRLYSQYSDTTPSNLPTHLNSRLLSFEAIVRLFDHRHILNHSLSIRDVRAIFLGCLCVVVVESWLPQRNLTFIDFIEAITRGAFVRHTFKQSKEGGEPSVPMTDCEFVAELETFVLEVLGRKDSQQQQVPDSDVVNEHEQAFPSSKSKAARPLKMDASSEAGKSITAVTAASSTAVLPSKHGSTAKTSAWLSDRRNSRIVIPSSLDAAAEGKESRLSSFPAASSQIKGAAVLLDRGRRSSTGTVGKAANKVPIGSTRRKSDVITPPLDAK